MKRDLPSAVSFRGINLASRLLPLSVWSYAISHSVIAIRRRHPEILERMGAHATAGILIDPIDMPLAVLLQPSGTRPASVIRLPAPCKWDARISGPITTLFAMVQGSLDGDALFFSRDIKIEGNTEVILALRNAIDATEIDLLAEISMHFGPLGPIAENIMRSALAIVEQSGGMGAMRAMRERP